MRKFPLYIFPLLALAACSDSDNLWETDEQYREYPDVVVPIELSIGADWSISFDDESRGAPPDAAENDAWEPDNDNDCGSLTHVRIVAFRRPDIDTPDGENPYDWSYDITNDREVVIDGSTSSEDHGLGSHLHRTARSKLIKQYGYEYRVIALAYSDNCSNPYYQMSQQTFKHDKKYTTHNCGNLYKNINAFCGGYTSGDMGSLVIETGTTLEEFHALINGVEIAEGSGSLWQEYLNGAQLQKKKGLVINSITHQIGPLDKKVIRVPQLYWGFCHLKSDNDPVIKYRELIPPATPEDDETYDAMLPLTGILYRGVAKVRVEVQAQERTNILWIALLGDNVLTKVDLNDYSCFNTAYEPLSGRNKYTMVSGAAVHQTDDAEAGKPLTIDAFLLPGRTRLAVRVSYTNGDIYNYKITAEANEINDPDNGTGIISPIYGDGEFYLRRNHYYHLKAATTARLLKNDTFN